MRTPRIAFLLVLLAGVASAQQQGSTSYPPERRTDAPTFMNAEVVRIDRAANRITSEARAARPP
jgi:NADPH-dependent 2,4-dienoyl-CoA reductase/sulfur reductase-like enzyme